MNTVEIIKLKSIGAISKEYFDRIYGYWEDVDDERLMEIEIEEMEN